MKAYKATTQNMTCLEFQYEMDKLFEMNESELQLCKKGFHFCKKLKDIDAYYYFSDKTNRYFEVEIPDDATIIDSPEGDKSITNKIKFIRELDSSDFEKNGMIRELDSHGNVIHYKDSNGVEYCWEYDSNDHLIYRKSFDGFERLWEYDAHGNMIHYKDSSEYEIWRQYDSNGNCIYFKDSKGYEEWREYYSNILLKIKDNYHE